MHRIFNSWIFNGFSMPNKRKMSIWTALWQIALIQSINFFFLLPAFSHIFSSSYNQYWKRLHRIFILNANWILNDVVIILIDRCLILFTILIASCDLELNSNSFHSMCYVCFLFYFYHDKISREEKKLAKNLPIYSTFIADLAYKQLKFAGCLTTGRHQKSNNRMT